MASTDDKKKVGRTVSSLPEASSVADEDLFLMSQNTSAKSRKVTATTLKTYINENLDLSKLYQILVGQRNFLDDVV